MTPIEKAIDLAGGPSAVARLLGVTAQAACFWRDGLRAFPSDHGATLEQATGGRVTRRELFPDSWQRIWPELAAEEQRDAA